MTDAPNRIPRSRQQEAPRAAYRWIGRSMKRVEDPRLLTGHGTYADDIHLPGTAHAVHGDAHLLHGRVREAGQRTRPFRRLGTGHDQDDPGQGLCAAGVDRLDAGMRMRAAEHCGMRHPG